MTIENRPKHVEILTDDDLARYAGDHLTAITLISFEQLHALAAGKLLTFGVQGEYGCLVRLIRESDKDEG